MTRDPSPKPTIPLEVRYAKHRLLPEIGKEGQDRLLESRFRVDPSDPAGAFAARLLELSGARQHEAGAPLPIAPRAGSVDDAHVAARDATRAAIAVVQRIREIVGLPRASNELSDARAERR